MMDDQEARDTRAEMKPTTSYTHTEYGLGFTVTRGEIEALFWTQVKPKSKARKVLDWMRWTVRYNIGDAIVRLGEWVR